MGALDILATVAVIMLPMILPVAFFGILFVFCLFTLID